MFCCYGFEACGDVAEETPNPGRNIPKSMRMTIYVCEPASGSDADRRSNALFRHTRCSKSLINIQRRFTDVASDLAVLKEATAVIVRLQALVHRDQDILTQIQKLRSVL
jgi:hypothetical protein